MAEESAEEKLGLLDSLSVLFTRRTRTDRRLMREAREQVKAEQRKREYEAWQKRQEMLKKAAGIARVEVVCDFDTWNFIWQKGLSHTAPAKHPNGDGAMVVGTLSGPNLLAVLDQFDYIRRNWTYVPHRVLADRIHDIIAAAVEAVDLDALDGEPVPPIRIDHRISDNNQ